MYVIRGYTVYVQYIVHCTGSKYCSIRRNSDPQLCTHTVKCMEAFFLFNTGIYLYTMDSSTCRYRYFTISL